MVCKNCAAMKSKPLSLRPLLLALTLVVIGGAGAAWAAKSDQNKPINIDYDRGGVDLVKQRTEFSGNVVLSKGIMVMRAARMDVRETSDGYRMAYASGDSAKPVTFRQALDVPGETMEGSADQVEYDTRSDTVRFIGNAQLRRMRGSTVADEVSGAVIHFDNRSEVFSVEGGQSSPHPAGRGRTVLMPRDAAASEPATAPLPLQPSITLQPRKPS